MPHSTTVPHTSRQPHINLLYNTQAKIQQQLVIAKEATKAIEQELAESKEAAERAQADFSAKLESSGNTSVGVLTSSVVRNIKNLSSLPAPYIYTVFDRIFVDFPAKNTEITPCIYGSGQPLRSSTDTPCIQLANSLLYTHSMRFSGRCSMLYTKRFLFRFRIEKVS